MDRLFNDNWTFGLYTLDATPEEMLTGSDAHRTEDFAPVDLPHDWLIGNVSDLYADGIGCYHKTFSVDIHNVIEKEGFDAFYVFDCLSELQTAWATDLMMGNFFKVTCDLTVSTWIPVITSTARKYSPGRTGTHHLPLRSRRTCARETTNSLSRFGIKARTRAGTQAPAFFATYIC